jgi:hypothetical protein
LEESFKAKIKPLLSYSIFDTTLSKDHPFVKIPSSIDVKELQLKHTEKAMVKLRALLDAYVFF